MKASVFEPTGGVLLELLLGKGAMDFAYLKATEYQGKAWTFERPTLVLPRGAGCLEVAVQGSRGRILLDATANLLVPARRAWSVTGIGAANDVLLVLPSPELLRATATEYAQPQAAMTAVFAAPFRFPRSLWLDEIHHRYFFERCVCGKRDNTATEFLEMELVKECYFAVKEQGRRQGEVPAMFQQQTVMTRAVAFIEANLFEDLTLDAIAKKAASSRAGVVRAFKKELGKAPFEYVHDRRLQEAMGLVRSGKRSITEVAHMVGYRSAGAFSQAFRKKYGTSPSDARSRP